jgi:hypothetical protein
MTPTPSNLPRPRTKVEDLSIGDIVHLDRTEDKHLVIDVLTHPTQRYVRIITTFKIPAGEFGRYRPKATPKEPFSYILSNDTLLEDVDITIAFRWDFNTPYLTFKSTEFNVLRNKYTTGEYMFDPEHGLARCRESTFSGTLNTKVFSEIVDSSLPLHAYGYFIDENGEGFRRLANEIADAVFIDQARRIFEETGESVPLESRRGLFREIKSLVLEKQPEIERLGHYESVKYCRELAQSTFGSVSMTALRTAGPSPGSRLVEKAKYDSFVDLVKADLGYRKVDPFEGRKLLSSAASNQRTKLITELIQLYEAAGVKPTGTLIAKIEDDAHKVAECLEPLLVMSPYDEANADEVDRIWVEAIKDLGPPKSKERHFAAKAETWETRKEEIIRKSHEYGHTPGGWPLGYVIDDISDFATAADEAEIEFRSAEKAFSNLKEVAEHIPKDIRFRDLELNTIVVFEDGDSYQTTALDVEEVTLTLLPKALRTSILNRKTLVFKSWELVPETVTATLEPPYASSVVCFGDLSEGEIIEETEGGRQWTFTRSDEPVAFLEPVHNSETQENRPKAVSNRSWPLHAFGFVSLRDD